MPIRYAIVLLASALALAACGEERDVEARNASVEEVANQVREASSAEDFIRPGKWLSQVTYEEMTAPGMPAEVTERMQRMMGQEESYESCLTEDEAQRPREDFFAGQSNLCRYDHFSMGGGSIDAQMRCSQGELTQLIEMDGTYSPESYQMRMATRMEGGPEMASRMTMRMRVDAKRVGECDPDEG